MKKIICNLLIFVFVITAINITPVMAESSDVFVKNFFAVGRDKSLSLSWRNSERSDISDIKIYYEDGTPLYVGSDIDLQPGAFNRLTVNKASDGKTLADRTKYIFSLEITYENGETYHGETMSNPMYDAYTMLWGAPKGVQEVNGWRESVSGTTYTQFKVQNKEKHSGNAALLVRANTETPVRDTFAQLGPNLKTAPELGKTYRFSYWRKSVNADRYFVGYGGRWGKNAYSETPQTADWEKITLPDFVYDGDEIRFQFEYGYEELYIDDAELFEVSENNITGDNLLENGGFEEGDTVSPEDAASGNIDFDNNGNAAIYLSGAPADAAFVYIYKKTDKEEYLYKIIKVKEQCYVTDCKPSENIIARCVDLAGNESAGISLQKEYPELSIKRFTAVSSNGNVTVSWNNGYADNILKTELYSGGTRLASSAAKPKSQVIITNADNARLSNDINKTNNVVISGLTPGETYLYRLRFTLSGGTVKEYNTSVRVKAGGNTEDGYEKSGDYVASWDSVFVGASYTETVLSEEALDGKYSVKVVSNAGGSNGTGYSLLIPMLSSELEAGKDYYLEFSAKSSGRVKFRYGAFSGENDNMITVANSNFDWQKYSVRFTAEKGMKPALCFPYDCDEIYFDNFKLFEVNSLNKPQSGNLIKNGDFENSYSNVHAQNLIAVGRDKRLTVSWKNTDIREISYMELVSAESGEVIASSDLNTAAGAVNRITVTELQNGKSYSYILKTEYADGSVCADTCKSNILGDKGRLIWYIPMGMQGINGWSEGVRGDPYAKIETTTEEKHGGDTSLKIRSNSENGITGVNQLFGPTLKNTLDKDKTYRLSYWRKTVNSNGFSVSPSGYFDSEKNSDWKKITLDDFEGTDSIYFIFDKGADGIYIDDVELYEISEGKPIGENLLVNGDFENIGSEILKHAEEIKKLLDECESRDISVDSEKSAYMILKRFSEYLVSDENNNVVESTLTYNKNACYSIYEKTKQSLVEKLSGNGFYTDIPRYITSGIEINRQSFLADVKIKNEIKEKYPVFFLGWVGYNMLRGDIDNLYDFGFNIIQQETSPSSMIIEADNEKGYTVDTSGAEWIVDLLKKCEEKNIAVNVLIAPHYFPGFLLEKYPELKVDEPGFIKYDVTNTIAQEVLKDYLKALIPMIKDSKALHSITLTNEPEFHSVAVTENPELTKKWQSYLEELYGNISALNSVYGKSYSSFAEVDMPRSETESYYPNDDSSAAYSDYINFNYKVFGDFHKMLAETIRELAPDIPLHTKMQNPIFITESYGKGGSREITYRGNDYEYLSGFFDINGNDSVSNYYTNHWFRDLEKSLFYDMQTSVKDVPVYNSEEHLQWAGNSYIGPEVAIQVYNDLWQGAIHGRSASTMWIWDRTYNTSSTNYNSILQRPDALANVAKAGLDMNRLSKEITCIQNKPADIAIFYSGNSRNFEKSYLASLNTTYTGAVMSGQKVQLVTDLTIDNLDKHTMLILPNTVSAYDNTVAKIAEFAQKGGKILLIGSDNLIYNEHKQSVSSGKRSSDLTYINSQASFVKLSKRGSDILNSDEIKTKIKAWLAENGKNKVRVTDSLFNDMNSVEWQWAYDGDDLIVNISNYSWEDISGAKILVDGNPVSDMIDLITGEELESTMTLGAHVPKLIRVADGKIYSHKLKFEADGVTCGSPEGKHAKAIAEIVNRSEDEVKVLLSAAVYKDGKLLSVTSESNAAAGAKTEISVTSDFPIVGDGYDYKVLLWNISDGMKPIEILDF